jgi:radical SAM protein with 4Fe4S-binding SPASM domain
MSCPVWPEMGLDELSREQLERLGGRRYPFAGSLELTERCNLRCVHCYINAPAGSRTARARELTAQQIGTIVEQIADAGTLYLLLTGGEVLLRPDFAEIYRQAKQKGFLLTLFTNGTLLTRPMADFLADWRPRALEITLYGATERTYERVTQVPGSYARCMRGIELALESHLPLRLKAMVLQTNRHELQEMKALAAQLGVEFRYDGVLWPRLDGGQQPYAQQLSVQDVVALDLDDPQRMSEWRREYSRMPQPIRSEFVYGCGAGHHAFHVDCAGKLSACMMARCPAFDLLQESFQEGWEHLGAVRLLKRQLDTVCRTCAVGVLCRQCPGWSQMVHGDDETPVAFICAMGRLREAEFQLSDP